MINFFGKKLQHSRKLKRMTLEELGNEVGSSKSYIWELENKEHCNPGAAIVWKLSKVLDVSFEYLIDDQYNIGTYPNLPSYSKEVEDIFHEVSKVYCEITGGRMSYPHYSARDVIAQYEEHLMDLQDNELIEPNDA